MGKISDALSKYATERRKDIAPQTPALELTGSEMDALLHYDHETGHLLKYNRETGQVEGDHIERLRMEGTIQRLLDNKLIYASGKLTPRGVEEAHKLKSRRPVSDEPLRLVLNETTAPTGDDAAIPAETLSREASAEGMETLGDDFLAMYEIEGITGKPATDHGPAGSSNIGSTEVNGAAGTAPTPPSVPFSANAQSPFVQAPAITVRPLQVKPALRKARPSSLSFDESAIDWGLVTLRNPHSYEAEQFKILRTNILFPVSGQPPRSILVTSTAPNEGKTFTSANLAVSIALNINKHVLLIDADLRLPQLHRRFGFNEGPGLSDYLADGKPLPSLLLKTKIDKLTLLPGGPPPSNPSELLSSERMATLLAEVTGRYGDRLIVVDAPPPGLTAETGVLARQVDGILIVVRFGHTRRDALVDLISRMGRQKILGTIVNHMESSSSRYYGYKYDGYMTNEKS